MNLLTRSRKLLSSVLRSHVVSEQMGVFGGVCSVHQAKCLSLCLRPPYTEKSASCRHWHRGGSSCQLNHTVFYSESNGRTNQRSAGAFEEEPHDVEHIDSPPVQRPSETFTLDVLVSLLRQENAVDLCVIKVPEHIQYADYFIIASGVSSRHLRAMALYAVKVYKFLKKDSDPHVKIEGKDAEDWMCIDFGKIVVHFMLQETREVYELEKLWTLRAYDEQLKKIPAEKLPEDFVLDLEHTK